MNTDVNRKLAFSERVTLEDLKKSLFLKFVQGDDALNVLKKSPYITVHDADSVEHVYNYLMVNEDETCVYAGDSPNPSCVYICVKFDGVWANETDNALTIEILLEAIEEAKADLQDFAEYDPKTLKGHVQKIVDFCTLSPDEKSLLETIAELIPDESYPIDEIDFDDYLCDDEDELADGDYESIADSETTMAYESISEGLEKIIKLLEGHLGKQPYKYDDMDSLVVKAIHELFDKMDGNE